jgi:hypothetical protein
MRRYVVTGATGSRRRIHSAQISTTTAMVTLMVATVMDGDLLKTVLGSSTVVGVMVAVVAGIMKLYQNHIMGRREDDRTESEWASEFRAAAEAHLPWDQEMRSNVIRLEGLVNDLRERNGLDPILFAKIPPAPPLFPRRGNTASPRFTQTNDPNS